MAVTPTQEKPPVNSDSPSPANVLEEDVSQAESVFKVYKRLWRFIRPVKFRALMMLLVPVPIGSLEGAMAFSMKPFVEGLQHAKTVENFSYVPLVVVGFSLVQGLLNYLSIYLNGWVGFKIMSGIRIALYDKLLSMDTGFFDNVSTGQIIQRFYRDPEAINTNILNNLMQLITRSSSSICLIAVLIYTSWKLSIIAVVILVIMLYPSTQIRKMIKKCNRQETGLSGRIIAMYNEVVGGAQVIHGYNLSGYRKGLFERTQQNLFDKTRKTIQIRGWLTPVMHLIAAAGVAIVIWQGSNMVISKEMTEGGFASFIVALLMLYNPMKNLGNNIVGAQTAYFAASRVANLLDLKPRIMDGDQAVPLEVFQQEILFENVNFEYLPGKPVLRNINLKIRKGEKIALVGTSGGGKSTLVSLIPRFYDATSGRVLIDGKDIRDYQMHSLRDQVAMVMQDNFMFDDTIFLNVVVGSKEFRSFNFLKKHNIKQPQMEETAEDKTGVNAMVAERTFESLPADDPIAPEAAEMYQKASKCKQSAWDALEKAYLKEFVSSLDDHIMTKTGERGIMLSGGQRQRLAIARALIKDAPIVILDEATSALDNQSEAIVQKAMDSLMVDRTVIMIAHRLSSLRNADRILVLEAGQIVEEGSHDELLRRNGRYTLLYNAQFGEEERGKRMKHASLPEENTREKGGRLPLEAIS